ncbi:glycine cleavage system protein GcvH [Candidatus Marinamargulisbacteria bacterium SCGC AG-439-L15]|nr:glycine cleavage system protein GcvH [Candidatus Marinamargulisbacteria bacterium SCGC AG-439-L15]
MTNTEKLYTEDHEWIQLEGDIATLGISAHAAAELGDVVYVDLLSAGESIEKAGEFGSVESVKTVSGLFSPISGEIIENNQAVIDAPESLNVDPENEGWLVKVKVQDTDGLDDLMSADAYETYLNTV